MGWDLDAFIEKLYRCEVLPEHIVKELCTKTKEVLLREGNIRSVSAPVTIVGDVHGQFYDLLEIFRISGFCPDTNYVFLGDYVDRGYHSVETITLLCCLKLRYPSKITLVRGNHESRAVTQTYGFYAECMKRYDSPNVWNYFTSLFDYMVLGVVIDDSILGVHGGLSPSLHTLDQIRAIDRFQEIPHEGPMADLVWSDPVSSSVADDKGDFAISPRGAGYIFGREVTKKFLLVNGLGHICRAHQLCMEGYQILFDDMLSTVWSAPNYCYRAGNAASVLEIDIGLQRFFNVFGPCPSKFRDSSDDAGFLDGTSGSYTTVYNKNVDRNAKQIVKSYSETAHEHESQVIKHINDRYMASFVAPINRYRSQDAEDEYYDPNGIMSRMDDGGLSSTYADGATIPHSSSGDDTNYDERYFSKHRFSSTAREAAVFNPSNIKLIPSSASCVAGWDDSREWMQVGIHSESFKENVFQSTSFNKKGSADLSSEPSADSGYQGGGSANFRPSRQGISSVVQEYFGGSTPSLSSLVDDHESDSTNHLDVNDDHGGDGYDHSRELANYSTQMIEPEDRRAVIRAHRQAGPAPPQVVDLDVDSHREYKQVLNSIRKAAKNAGHESSSASQADSNTDSQTPAKEIVDILKSRVTGFRGGRWQVPGFTGLLSHNGGGYMPGTIAGEYDYIPSLRNPFVMELDETGHESRTFMFGQAPSDGSNSPSKLLLDDDGDEMMDEDNTFRQRLSLSSMVSDWSASDMLEDGDVQAIEMDSPLEAPNNNGFVGEVISHDIVDTDVHADNNNNDDDNNNNDNNNDNNDNNNDEGNDMQQHQYVKPAGGDYFL